MMQKTGKYFALCAVLILTFTSTAGCIDVHYFKDLLAPQKEEEIMYVVNEYVVGNYNFTSDIYNPDNWIDTHDEEWPATIKSQTSSLRFDIDIQMQSAEEVWEGIPENIIKDFLEEYVEQILEILAQRYIEVTITSPDGVEWYSNRFNDSQRAEFPEDQPLDGPSEGDWIVHVEGAGIGLKREDFEYHDSISVKMTAREPLEEE